jgi:hypothetical protein
MPISHTGSSTNDWIIKQMQETDKEKLRAFEQKMQDEGADGFADGPRPWETWDESGAQAGGSRHVWEGKARRIYKTTQIKRSIGDRILSSLASIALITMLVGIVGVYLTEEKPRTVAWTAITPTPIPLPGQLETAHKKQLPARTMPVPVIAEIESLPPSAAGSSTSAVDNTPAEAAASEVPSLAASGPEPAIDAPAVREAAGTPALSDDPFWNPAASEDDIEIVTAPSALLLTSPTDSSAESDNDAPDMEMDPSLAMEIATAPALDGSMDVETVTTTEPLQDTTRTTLAPAGSGSTGQLAATPARDLINRGTSSPAVADSMLPEAGIETAGLATETKMDTATDAIPGASEPSQPVGSLADATTTRAAGSEAMAVTTVEAVENLPPAAAGDKAPMAPTSSPETPGATIEQTGGDPNDSNETMAAGNDSGTSENSVVALADPVAVTTQPAPASKAAAPKGNWVVNLASYNHEAMARKMLDEFQAKGVTVEIENITINDRQMYRIRVTGFESSRSARASISSLEETLGLKGAWISRR